MVKEKEIILTSIRNWVLVHPKPDVPAIDIGQLLAWLQPRIEGGSLSPRQIYTEIRDETELGKWLLRVIEAGIDQTSTEDVLNGFRVRG